MKYINQKGPNGEEKTTRRCAMITRAYKRNSCSATDYFYNLNLHLVEGDPACWADCLRMIPEELTRTYLEYIYIELEKQDYKPHPYSYLFGDDSLDYIEAKKLELYPRYKAVVELARSMLGGK